MAGVVLKPTRSAMSSVYTFGPTFRAEKSHTKKHLSEFLMVEAEVVTGDKGLSAILDLVEGLYKHTVDTVLRQSSEEVDLFHKHIASSPDTKVGGVACCWCGGFTAYLIFSFPS